MTETTLPQILSGIGFVIVDAFRIELHPTGQIFRTEYEDAGDVMLLAIREGWPMVSHGPATYGHTDVFVPTSRIDVEATLEASYLESRGEDGGVA